ncbi:PREDICTED: G protein-activated inward rectifier potassium channel 3-like [Priapulus caudatus]|uniref:G protein-activated inward rectifier potassium channel 3-like n=1 Tax=Priapulus caudatus TaxID=37621 RepID=A0ABM1F5I6_PRICU|nr:PREDICTED: G protein-activated inward rectifier potassium channel 3-like [Priapulus caudatus]
MPATTTFVAKQDGRHGQRHADDGHHSIADAELEVMAPMWRHLPFSGYSWGHSGSPSSPSSAAQRRRVVDKNGVVNVTACRVERRGSRFMADFFTTLLDVRWRWTIAVFVAGFLLSWLFFAGIWYAISYAHGDFSSSSSSSSADDDGDGSAAWRPCLVEQTSFASSFLFSLETQHTIGYGSRSITEECPEAIFTLVVQSIVGVLIQCFVVGMVFAKISRPNKRAQTIVFSKLAVVCARDGALCLQFRVGDMRRSQIISAHVRALLYRTVTTREGDVLPLHRFDLDVGVDDGGSGIFMMWPVVVTHRIDVASPFYAWSADDFATQDYEVVVVLEGVAESTGGTTQARTSYVNDEVVWARQFRRLATYQRDLNVYRLDFAFFDDVTPVDVERVSARERDERARQHPLGGVDGGRVLPTYTTRESVGDDDDETDDSDISQLTAVATRPPMLVCHL